MPASRSLHHISSLPATARLFYQNRPSEYPVCSGLTFSKMFLIVENACPLLPTISLPLAVQYAGDNSLPHQKVLALV